ncbi:MAG: hypothetical protein M3Z02_00010 [Actinomycetota bacterium]|nr:hypothetical protein [Actinomycetota bacterium]
MTDAAHVGAFDLAAPAGPFVTVRLLRFPLRHYARTREHYDELMREFSLIASDPPTDRPDRHVPARLLELVDVLGQQYAATSAAPDAARDEALERGDASIDLTYEIPKQGSAAATILLRLLEEADQFCQQGQSLLTLAAPADAVVFRRWWLGEFVRQVDGMAPEPWPGGLD